MDPGDQPLRGKTGIVRHESAVARIVERQAGV
jgi:hypothetical protein